LSAKDIAEAYGIPSPLLAKILQRLTKAGLLSSHAGINGGYALSRDARQITAFDVIRAIDGPLFITSCETGPRGCDLTASCTVREPLRKVNESISDVLRAIRVSDLCDPEASRRHHPASPEALVTLRS
jgi:Rrf2 family protein